MQKINITKPTGNLESLSLLSAFKADNQTWVILDSETIGSMGLPIIYVSKYTTKLEKITDANEWQAAKNYLKAIINGGNFDYVTIPDNVGSDDAYYTPLTLPVASYDAIKNNYVVNNANTNNNGVTPIMPSGNVGSNSEVSVDPVIPVVAPIEQVSPIEPVPSVTPTPQVAATPSIEPVVPAAPVNLEPPINNSAPMPEVAPAPSTPVIEPVVSQGVVNTNNSSFNFDSDKETFLKACENMFDALISKYKKEIADLERREQDLKAKEQVVSPTPVNQAMDLSSIMPHMDNNQTGV